MEKTYEVWALAYNKDYEVMDFEQLLGEFETKPEAIKFAKKLDPNVLIDKKKLDNDDIVHIQVETVVEIDGGYENIDTIYENDYTLTNGILV